MTGAGRRVAKHHLGKLTSKLFYPADATGAALSDDETVRTGGPDSSR
jgi:hypothetical protein